MKINNHQLTPYKTNEDLYMKILFKYMHKSLFLWDSFKSL
jgi:hypothetical protein